MSSESHENNDPVDPNSGGANADDAGSHPTHETEQPPQGEPRRPLTGSDNSTSPGEPHQDGSTPGGLPQPGLGRGTPLRSRRPTTLTIFILLLLLISVLLLAMSQGLGARKIAFSPDFIAEVEKKNIKQLEVRKATGEVIGELREAPADDPDAGTRFTTTLPADELLDPNFLQKLKDSGTEDAPAIVTFESESDNAVLLILIYLLPAALLIGVMVFLYRRAQSQMGGGGILGGFGKSPARRYEANKSSVSFNDVAGLDNVKKDLQEIVEFLKNPEKFQRLGGRIPKGTLLVGPPGTGKTLLARAVAGEAGVPFFSINGSEFIQMFVGVGASRVRDLFKTAKDHSPCILFIDEIDAVGRVRGAGLGGGHDEREQTLNQILSEMDGFEGHDSVIVLAASNRPDVLDPALLRPGRFDRHITVDRPRLKGRIGLFEVHTRDVPVADDVDFDRLARGTIGMTGADIRNLVNEAALWAARVGREKVSMDDFEAARDKVLMGPKRDEVLSEAEKELTAYHEAGHALLAWLLPGVDRLHKVAIVPRGRALGVTQILPEEDRLNVSEKELHSRLSFIMGGRAAEKLIYDELSAGAEDDLKKATQLARRMVTTWGMSERLGPVNYQTSDDHPFLGKEIHEHRQFSEQTANIVDEEVSRILNGAFDCALDVLTTNRDKLEALARALEDVEELEEDEIAKLIGPSRYNSSRNGSADNGEPVEERQTTQESSSAGDAQEPS
ncbi:MAG: ATP-dependent zinc metalloprotease FtsH [Pirellulales bacterium]|nr:ATP-dependent zinc metalloprotease FtsH [Pirellulales bacterium]